MPYLVTNKIKTKNRIPKIQGKFLNANIIHIIIILFISEDNKKIENFLEQVNKLTKDNYSTKTLHPPKVEEQVIWFIFILKIDCQKAKKESSEFSKDNLNVSKEYIEHLYKGVITNNSKSGQIVSFLNSGYNDYSDKMIGVNRNLSLLSLMYQSQLNNTNHMLNNLLNYKNNNITDLINNANWKESIPNTVNNFSNEHSFDNNFLLGKKTCRLNSNVINLSTILNQK